VIPYTDFLQTKHPTPAPVGFAVAPDEIHPDAKEHQRAIVAWAVHQGRAAIFADTGLGKTLMLLEWARLISRRAAIIVAPLSVARQTVREGERWGIAVRYVRSAADVDGPGIYVTNYELIEHFDAALFDAVVLDESSILKALDGKTRQRLTVLFAETPYRLCCTATPAPNDIAEIGNHAEFLGIMRAVEMKGQFFVHDDNG
jgi:superfamily II DNA or RNA helicase